MRGTMAAGDAVSGDLQGQVARRAAANTRFFEGEAERLAVLCHRMAECFARGGRLLACGRTPAARSDVRHVAVEFVHPVIVGKRALPALGLSGEAGTLVAQLEPITRPDDMLIAFGADGAADAIRDELEQALDVARRHGALTISFGETAAEFDFAPPSPDPFIRQELIETLYHILWELVHVFFEHRGLLDGRNTGTHHDAGASSFLYPFLAEQERNLDGVLVDVGRSIRMKAAEVTALRAATIEGSGRELLAAAAGLRDRLNAGGTLLACGNGGSATDALDLVADMRSPPALWPSRAALDLTEDTAILTAVANDIGTDAMFSRQVIAYGRESDALVVFSTSGGSRNIIRALEEAKRRGLQTIAFVGYDGGRIVSEGLADHIILSPLEHIPRIQEAQATAYHLLRERIERPD
jgi:D-sedoheptulose 7-phosphate isomerase